MTFKSRALLLVTLVLLVLTACLTSAFEFAPVLSTFTADEGTGSYAAALAVCGGKGAYLAAEPTVSSRTHHAQLGGATGKATWYAFLGANSEAPTNITPVCKASAKTNALDAASPGDCLYRWRMGRYLEFSDASVAVGAKWFYRSGISFYRGSLVSLTTSDCTYTVNGTITMPCGPINGFRSFFMTAANAPAGTSTGSYISARPGFDNGHYIILVGTGNTSVWSDNEAAGGYTYEGATASGTVNTFGSDAAIAATKSSFIAMCDAQAPSRVMLEPYNDPRSNSNLLWWVIFLVLLFFTCSMFILVISCCQEREDMDEPPEDAPEWAREEARQVSKPKRYVSQSSFRIVPQRDHYDEREMDSYSDMGSASDNDGDGKNPQHRRKEAEQDDSGSNESDAEPQKKKENNWMS